MTKKIGCAIAKVIFQILYCPKQDSCVVLWGLIVTTHHAKLIAVCAWWLIAPRQNNGHSDVPQVGWYPSKFAHIGLSVVLSAVFIACRPKFTCKRRIPWMQGNEATEYWSDGSLAWYSFFHCRASLVWLRSEALEKRQHRLIQLPPCRHPGCMGTVEPFNHFLDGSIHPEFYGAWAVSAYGQN